jgi:hypothetical protein
VGAEEDRRAAAVRAFEPAEQIAHASADPLARIVLDSLEAEPPQGRQHGIGDRPLAARRARDRRELEEELEGAARCDFIYEQ